MSNKLIVLSAILLGTLLSWGIFSFGFEIRVALQGESMQKGVVVLDPVTGEKLTIWMDSKTNLKTTESALFENVDEFGPLHIGGTAPNGFGQIAPFEGREIPKLNFYVYVHRRGLSLCEYDGCSVVEGKVIACMGGWLSGDGRTEVSDLVGLDSSEVAQGRASIVVISDGDSKIIGIYPNHTEGDILPILSQFPEYGGTLNECIDREIGSLG